MSVWKKAGKANQKTHRERHQPEDRQHLGLLEKKKDYIKRAGDYNDKKATLKLLKRRALNKNPDEFYYHMIKSKVEDGKHFDREDPDEDSPDQLKLMRTQDLKYVTFKRTQEMRKIERLQAQLHLCSVDVKPQNKRIVFGKNVEPEEEAVFGALAERELPEVDCERLVEISKKRKSVYKELAKRIKREKELAVVQQKLEVNRLLESKRNVLPPKKVRKGTKDAPPVYKWKYERKK